MFDRVVAVFGMPRSGTSWAGQILDSSPDVAFRLEPIFSYAFKDAVGAASTPGEFRAFFEGIYRSQDPFLLQADKRAEGTYPTFEEVDAPPVLAIKTTRYHNLLSSLLERCPYVRVASVVRHPCGAIHSWLTASKEFPADADPATEWRGGSCRNAREEEFWGFEDWKAVTLEHLELERRLPERFRIFRYEELVERPLERTMALFEFAGLAVGDQTRAFLDDCHRRHSADQHAVFKDKSVATRWQSELETTVREAIVGEVRGTPLARFL